MPRALCTSSPDHHDGPCRQEGVTGALAAGSFLEELAKAAKAQPHLTASMQQLSTSLEQACSRLQDAFTRSAMSRGRRDLNFYEASKTAAEYAGRLLRHDALAVACCQTWQVSAGLLPGGPASRCLLSCNGTPGRCLPTCRTPMPSPAVSFSR